MHHMMLPAASMLWLCSLPQSEMHGHAPRRERLISLSALYLASWIAGWILVQCNGSLYCFGDRGVHIEGVSLRR